MGISRYIFNEIEYITGNYKIRPRSITPNLDFSPLVREGNSPLVAFPPWEEISFGIFTDFIVYDLEAKFYLINYVVIAYKY